jgi:hypothetical protein
VEIRLQYLKPMQKGRLSLLFILKKNLRFIAIPEEYHF